MSASHPIHRVTAFAVVGPYTLSVTFEDGACRVIDFLPILRGELYGPLRERAIFDQVSLDAEVHTLVWPNGADFDPLTLHEWPTLGADMLEMARTWSDSGADSE